ncbi:MAG: aminotransferase class III-fold pyridoxal phosphate-dependent enzyme, partial [Clostridia bacterium]|nr:aminotransferase class III-fold pyridoxal phosphate-dependent enzyme [Clostridia bacterium]
IEEENLCERSTHLGELFLRRMEKMKSEHKIIGDVRGKGCLLAMELVKDRETKEPFEEAGSLVYQKAFAKGLAWVPSHHILRISPPLIMEDDMAEKGLDIMEEAVAEAEKQLGY